MPVATMIAVAMAFWASHGQPTMPPVTWDWGVPAAEYKQDGVQARAVYGSQHISMSRLWWRLASNRERCQVVIHEVGHASYSFEHKRGTVMAQYIEDAPTPGTCIRSRRAWRVRSLAQAPAAG